MSKKLGLMLLTLSLILSSTAVASGIDRSTRESRYNNGYWYTATCNEDKKVEVYSGDYGIYLDHFKNNDSSSKFILSTVSITTGKYILINPSITNSTEGLVILNRGFWNNSTPRTVNGKQTVRHLTTAEEESNNAHFKYKWSMDNAFIDELDGRSFSVPNFRSDGTHPAIPTKFDNWDAEFRTITLYDEDHDIETSSDNKVIVECQKMVIRRCGDGILDKNHEECDPKVQPWIDNNACDPVTCKEKTPVCSGHYNGETFSSLAPGNYLCEVGTMTHFNETSTGWTWKCDNVAGNPANCYAKKASKGTLDIEKTLVSETEYVTETGQELVWKITVTAKGGDVEGVKIKDYLPAILTFKGMIPELPSGVTMGSAVPVQGADATGNYLLWTTEGTLKNGESIVLTITTKVNTMPSATDNYENVACTSAPGVPEDCEPVPVKTKGGLNVKKEIIKPADGIITKKGEQVIWKITVKAEGGDVKMEYIKDTLPAELQYEDYTVQHKPEGIIIEKPVESSNGREITWETKGTLKSGEYIELNLMTRVVELPDPRNEKVINIACAKPNPGEEECGSGSTTRLWIKKYILDGNKEVKNITLKPGDTIVYKIKFGNDGNVPAYVSIKDFLPKGVTFLSGSLNITYTSQGQQHGGGEVSYNGENITIEGIDVALYSGVFLRGGYEGVLIIYAQIPESVTDEGLNTTNFACIYNQSGTRVDCDNAIYYIGMMCEKLEIPAGDLPNEGGSKEVTCTTTSGKIAKTIEIDCGEGASGDRYIRKSNASSLKGTCTYPSGAKKYSLQCKVDGETPTDNCKGSVTVREGPGPKKYAICESKYKDGVYVACKATKKENKAHFRLDCGNKTYYYEDSREREHTFKECKNYEDATCYVQGPDDSMWKTSTKCGNQTPYCEKHPDNPVCDLADPKCLNVNEGNFSIESGEYLPFYFNVRREIESSHKFKFVKDESESCNVGDVDLGSLKCKYLILSPDDNEIVYSKGNINCLELGDDRHANDNLIKQWANEQKHKYGINLLDDYSGRYWPHIEVSKSSTWKTNDILGEYKFQIEVREYKQCNDKGERDTIKITEQDAAVCQSNFVLTEPYTVQKTPSGNLTASTRTLSKFRQVDGLKPFSDYLNTIDTSEYSPNQKVAEAMDAFISKYEKLAVKVNTDKFGKDNTTTVKKVPGKDIYFVNGDVTFTQTANTINKAFTIVQTNGSTTIIGNLQHNMMLLTKGNIKFSGDCTTNQTVKGIFYAGGELKRTGVLHNNDLNNDVWCTKGGLNVKGVLIGNNFEDSLMKKSRSHLEKWFYGDGKSAKSIMNGASVLIEYSPSIFSKSTMPPGAEDFTTALSIYKQ